MAERRDTALPQVVLAQQRQRRKGDSVFRKSGCILLQVQACKPLGEAPVFRRAEPGSSLDAPLIPRR